MTFSQGDIVITKRTSNLHEIVRSLDDYWYETIDLTSGLPWTLCGPELTLVQSLNINPHRSPAEMKALLQGSETCSSESCVHEWKSYTGAWEVFDYCLKCDVKK